MLLAIGSDVGSMNLFYSKTLDLAIRLLYKYELIRLVHLPHGDS